MQDAPLHVAIDVGCRQHHVALASARGKLFAEFDIEHAAAGFMQLFMAIEQHREPGQPVWVAMEGYNGYARPLDREILRRGYRLLNVNNLKLARFKEVFPAAAKTDALDTHRMLELMRVQAHVALAKRALQEVTPPPTVNAKLQALTRRRRQLVLEKVRVVNRMQANLQAVCPGLAQITAEVDNRWFLNLLVSRKHLGQLATMRRSSVLKIPAVGRKYAAVVADWQKRAHFAAEAEWIGPMIYDDARRILTLLDEIATLERQIAALAETSELYQRINSVPGFGLVCSAELAGEIGTHQRFAREASMALYLGASSLDNSSGQSKGCKTARQVNHRAKAALMTAADHHRKGVPQSQRYYEKKRAEGKTHNQAVRSLARHLVRVLWSMLIHGRDYELREPNRTVQAA